MTSVGLRQPPTAPTEWLATRPTGAGALLPSQTSRSKKGNMLRRVVIGAEGALNLHQTRGDAGGRPPLSALRPHRQGRSSHDGLQTPVDHLPASVLLDAAPAGGNGAARLAQTPVQPTDSQQDPRGRYTGHRRRARRTGHSIPNVSLPPVIYTLVSGNSGRQGVGSEAGQQTSRPVGYRRGVQTRRNDRVA